MNEVLLLTAHLLNSVLKLIVARNNCTDLDPSFSPALVGDGNSFVSRVEAGNIPSGQSKENGVPTLPHSDIKRLSFRSTVLLRLSSKAVGS